MTTHRVINLETLLKSALTKAQDAEYLGNTERAKEMRRLADIYKRRIEKGETLEVVF